MSPPKEESRPGEEAANDEQVKANYSYLGTLTSKLQLGGDANE